MLEYSVEDAESLLTSNLTAAKESLLQVDEDLDFLRDQYTTTEVSILCHQNFEFEKVSFCFSELIMFYFYERQPNFPSPTATLKGIWTFS